MEFGFNLAWLILSLVLSMGCAWTANQGRGRHAHRASFLALVILIALLFPVVSISDDLHEDQAKITSEEPRYKDDLHQHFESARLQIDHDRLALDLALTTKIPALEIVHFEEVRARGTALTHVCADYPPTLHDLP